MLALLVLIAEGDPVAGTTGWVGAGLLGLVLYWLLFHGLPAKDKQILDLVKNKDEAVNQVISAFRNEIANERSACEKNTERVAQSIERLAGHLMRNEKEPPA